MLETATMPDTYNAIGGDHCTWDINHNGRDYQVISRSGGSYSRLATIHRSDSTDEHIRNAVVFALARDCFDHIAYAAEHGDAGALEIMERAQELRREWLEEE